MKNIAYYEKQIIEYKYEIELLKTRVSKLESRLARSKKKIEPNKGEAIFQKLVPSSIRQYHVCPYDFLCGSKKIEVKYSTLYLTKRKSLGSYRYRWTGIKNKKEADRIILIGEDNGKLDIFDLSKELAHELAVGGFGSTAIVMQMYSLKSRGWKHCELIKYKITEEELTKRYNLVK
jgi:hypothetical protein